MMIAMMMRIAGTTDMAEIVMTMQMVGITIVMMMNMVSMPNIVEMAYLVEAA